MTDSANDPEAWMDDGLRFAFGQGAPLPSEPTAASSEWIDGRYRLIHELGRGGMGVVYRALDEELGREVALKVLRPETLTAPMGLQRFTGEAKVCAQLQHPAIVPLYDAGVDEGGAPWFTMRLVDGVTLKAVLAQADSQKRVDRALSVFEAVSQAVAFAHDRGVIHRDLKPSNVMVGGFGQTFVLDWGLAKVLRHSEPGAADLGLGAITAADPGVSVSGSVVGTHGYMAPEQARGEIEDLGPTADVFALGSLLTEILTGRCAYAGHPDLRAASRSGDLSETLDRLGQVEDRELAELARQCLAEDPTERPADAGIVAHRMTAWRESLEHRRQAAEREAIRAKELVVHERRVRRRTVLAATAIAVSGLMVLGTLEWRRQEQERLRLDSDRAIVHHVSEARALLEASPSWSDEEALSKLERGRDLIREAQRLGRQIEFGTLAPQEIEHLGQLLSQQHADRTAALAAQRRDQRLAERLDTLADALGNSRDQPTRLRALGVALQEFGIDLEDPPAAAATIRASVHRDRLIHALHDGIGSPLYSGSAELDVLSAHLRALVEAADDDSWRAHFRKACFDRDLDGLLEMARSPAIKELPPSNALLLGDALMEHGFLGEAEAVLRASRRFHEGDIYLNKRLCLLCVEQEHWEEAVAFGRAAEALQPGFGGGYLFMIALVKSRRIGEAEALIERLASLPRDAATIMTEAYLANHKGDRVAQERLADELRDLWASLPEAWISRGKILSLLGRWESAAESFRRAATLTTDVNHLCLIGSGLVFAQQAEEGLALLHETTDRAPHNAALLETFTALLFKASRWSRCTEVGARAIALQPQNYQLHYFVGLSHAQLLQFPEAARALRDAQRVATTDQEREKAARALGSNQETAQVFETAYRVTAGSEVPESTDRWSDLIGCAKAFEACATSARLWERLRTTAPDIFAGLPLSARAESIARALEASAGRGVEPVSPSDRSAFLEMARRQLAADLAHIHALPADTQVRAARRFRFALEGFDVWQACLTPEDGSDPDAALAALAARLLEY